MRLAVIPARGGSKRIPRKNIREFCGKPIIGWSIEAAIDSDCFDQVIVSTDDEEIAGVAREFGADTPFIRPADLSDDHTGTTSVISHAIRFMQEAGEHPDEVCGIYATAPFLRIGDLRRGFSALHQFNADYVFAVTRFPSPVQRALRITEKRQLEMFYPECLNARSQDLEEAYHDAGQFYWGRASAWLAGIEVLSSGAAPVILPSYCVQDIDTLEDWERAELMFSALRKRTESQ